MSRRLSIVNSFLNRLYEKLTLCYPDQKEYLQAVKLFFESIDGVFQNNPDIQKLGIIERLVEPDRTISFKVPWIGDDGQVYVNKGYRVQFNNSIGPYKGGIRFDASVNESILKFLGFEQTFKNSLTGLPLGGAKGGADFDPRGRSDLEIMRFCQSYMIELFKIIGPDLDIPAGDLGVGQKEIGYLYGMYKRLTNKHHGSLTGKGISYGGSFIRPEATGYGLCYITEHALETYYKTTFKDKTVIISGTGNVALPTAHKARELGAKIIGMSNIDGVIHDEKGIDIFLIETLKNNQKPISDYLLSYPKAIFYENPKALWTIKTDIALPCATQNELDEFDAKTLIDNGLMLLAEGANMPSTINAIKLFINHKIVFIPAKAANAGGVATSGFEMTQNAISSVWIKEKVDEQLKITMHMIFEQIYQTALENNHRYDLEKAANTFSFKKIFDAMKAQGI